MKQLYAHFIYLAAAIFIAVTASCAPRQATAAVADNADTVPQFSADSAMAFIKRQTDMGPRCPGHPGHAECARWLAAELRRHGADTVVMQKTDLDGYGPMTNILAQYNPRAQRRILLLAHWDTRPTADADPDPANRSLPIDGANDGASGVAVLLETARLMSMHKPQQGVDLLFVDAEDSGTEHDDDSWARGAQYFAENLPYGPGCPAPAYGVLLDMVGGKDARFGRELFSEAYAPAVNNKLWTLAARNGLGHRFANTAGGAVNDDHIPLLRAGIPTVDIIETNHPSTGSFNPTWHTLSDTYDNIDPLTIGDVGRLITLLIYEQH